MTERQKEELLNWADELRYREIFEKLAKLGAKDNLFFVLRREYIHQGANPDYLDRVKSYIDSFEPDQSVISIPWFKNRKIWAGIGIFALLLMGVWYFFYNRDLQECKALLSFLEKKKVLIQIIQKIERQEIKLLPQEGDTLLFRKADSSLLKIYFERCVNEKTTLGKLVRLKTNEEYVMDIRIETLDQNFKTLTVTEHAEGKETIAHYFELDSDFRVAVYEDIKMKESTIHSIEEIKIRIKEDIKDNETDLVPKKNEKTGKWGFVHKKTGKLIIDYQFDEANYFQEGLAGVLLNNKYGFIDKTGKLIIGYQFDEADPFQEGLAGVLLDNKYGFIDKTGKIIINYQFDLANSFQEGLAIVVLDNKLGFIDKTGKVVINYQFDGAFSFQEGLARVRLNKKWGFIDKTGKFIIDYQFDEAGSFQEGLARVLLNGKSFYINKKGECVKDCP